MRITRDTLFYITIGALMVVILLVVLYNYRDANPTVGMLFTTLNGYWETAKTAFMDLVGTNPVMSSLLSGGIATAVTGYLGRMVVMGRERLYSEARAKADQTVQEATTQVQQLLSEKDGLVEQLGNAQKELTTLQASYAPKYLAELQDTANRFIQENYRLVLENQALKEAINNPEIVAQLLKVEQITQH